MYTHVQNVPDDHSDTYKVLGVYLGITLSVCPNVSKGQLFLSDRVYTVEACNLRMCIKEDKI